MENSKIIHELKELLIKRIGNIIERVILFGSRVNKEYQEYSDYDILIVLKSEYDWQKEKEIFNACYDLDLKYDILIDAKVISLSELDSLRGKQPYIQNALNTGISA